MLHRKVEHLNYTVHLLSNIEFIDNFVLIVRKSNKNICFGNDIHNRWE